MALKRSQSELNARACTLTALVTAELSEKPSICKQQVKLRLMKVPVQGTYEYNSFRKKSLHAEGTKR